MIFQNRAEAGERLVNRLVGEMKGKGLVLGIPRGGVVAAKAVAEKLDWPLGVVVTKKIGFPGNEELAMGAVAEKGKPVWDEKMCQRYGVSQAQRQAELRKAKKKVEGYIKKFRQGKGLSLKDKLVIVVDDGIATGRTVEAAIKYLQGKVKKIVLAVPVCALDTAERLKPMVDEFVCLHTTANFMAVGQFYREFEQVSDKEVKKFLVE